MLKHAELGTVSHGTLVSQDLFVAFHDELETQLGRQERTPENRDEIDRLWSVYHALSEKFYDDDGELINVDTEEMDYANETLIDALQQFAGPFVMFGSHPGDGSDFGYWFDSDSLENAVQEGDCIKVDSMPSYVAVVSDHGNVTVYEINPVEVT